MTVPYIWELGLISFPLPHHSSYLLIPLLSSFYSYTIQLLKIRVLLSRRLHLKKVDNLTTFYHLWSYRFASVLTIKLDLFEWLWFLNNFFDRPGITAIALLFKTVFQIVDFAQARACPSTPHLKQNQTSKGPHWWTELSWKRVWGEGGRQDEMVLLYRLLLGQLNFGSID